MSYKGILWDRCGEKTKIYGGATYKANGVPDIGADTMITKCSDLSTDFSKIEVGESVWMKGHIGVYIGDGLAVECTPKWENDVQITACNCTKSGYNRRNWTKHGKLPYVTYVVEEVKPEIKPEVKPTAPKTPKVGDIVTFKGNTHYASSNSTRAVSCRGGKAKITQIYKLGQSKHPYHRIRVSGGGATVYGWVDDGSFTKA